MIYTYKELLKKYGTQRKVKEKVLSGNIYHLSRGMYSDEYNTIDEEYIKKRFPNAVLTGKYAVYSLNLTDYIPEDFEIATLRNATRVKHKFIKQCFQDKKIINIGKTKINGLTIYDLERMIIELFRFKNKYPNDYYKEIVHNLRARSDEIDIKKLKIYLGNFTNGKSLYSKINEVIF